MHLRAVARLLVLALGATFTLLATAGPEWGFFGHRRLNRLAVFTLDPDMMPLYRAQIEFLTDHAVDPDKRRYASPFEAVRHYIDLDHWGKSERYRHVPRRWTDALLYRGEIQLTEGVDTIIWRVDTILQGSKDYAFAGSSEVILRSDAGDNWTTDLARLRNFYYHNYLPKYYDDEKIVAPDSLAKLGLPFAGQPRVELREHFTEFGILPYHLLSMQRRLTNAFIDRDAERIIRLSAEMGHYLGDAHVPLHTTENYNGQLTGQTGIHAFWESRLPELFADDEYDFFVGKARYIEEPRDYYWEIVLKSHSLVDSVLNSERRLRKTYPQDQQMVFDERLGRTVKIESREFSDAWSREMQGMVEERFRAAILSIGSVWYTCWVDAGQPDLTDLVPPVGLLGKSDTLDRAVGAGVIRGREH